MGSTAAPRTPLVSNFSARQRTLAQQGPDWLRAMRSDGMARYGRLGLPSTRLEEWRGTNLAPLGDTDFVPANGSAHPGLLDGLPALGGLDLGGPRLVFVDGRYDALLSLAPEPREGLWVGGLAQALVEVPERLRPLLTRRGADDCAALEALNTALLDDGAVVLAEAGVDAGAPIQLLFVNTGGERPTATHPRTLIAAGRGSRLRAVELHLSLTDDVYFTNAVTELVAEDDADLDHCKILLESPRAYHVATIHSRQTRDSRCTQHNVILDGRLVRQDIVSVLNGQGAICRLNGLYLTRDAQHVDTHTVLDHAQPHGSSREVYKGILDGDSRTVFNGRIIVRQAAQKTDAKQSNPNLLLSSGARASTRPQLEIYADDVKCTHGATIGRLDEEAIFYLRSRGLSQAEARNLMVSAFAGEVLAEVEAQALREELVREVDRRLPRLAAEAG